MTTNYLDGFSDGWNEGQKILAAEIERLKGEKAELVEAVKLSVSVLNFVASQPAGNTVAYAELGRMLTRLEALLTRLEAGQ